MRRSAAPSSRKSGSFVPLIPGAVKSNILANSSTTSPSVVPTAVTESINEPPAKMQKISCLFVPPKLPQIKSTTPAVVIAANVHTTVPSSSTKKMTRYYNIVWRKATQKKVSWTRLRKGLIERESLMIPPVSTRLGTEMEFSSLLALKGQSRMLMTRLLEKAATHSSMRCWARERR